MLRKIYIFSLIISVLMLISCEKSSTEERLLDGAISFSPTIVEADWSAVGNKNKNPDTDTKGAFSTNISTIGVMAFWSAFDFGNVITTIQPNLMYNQRFTKGDVSPDVWTTSTTFYWPVGGNLTSFFAYAPYADATNGITVSTDKDFGVPKVTYQMPVVAAKQPDLLIANAHRDATYTGNSVALSFERAFAAIGFRIIGTRIEEVSSIGIVNIVDHGTINMSDLGPTDPTDPTTPWVPSAATTQLYEIGLTGGGPVTVTQTATNVTADDDGYLMVIPQIYPETSKVKVTIGTRESSISLPVNGKWERGKRYIYTLVISDGVLSDDLSYIVIPWGKDVSVSDDIKDPSYFDLDSWGGPIDVADEL